MAKKIIKIAIIYDFDGTLSPGSMHEHDFIPKLEMTSKNFWQEVDRIARKHKADKILAYMYCMIEKAHQKGISVRREDISNYGKNVKLFPGVKKWFDMINKFGRDNDARIEHYIISSGLKEMISATSIKKYFTEIFASSFMYDNNGVACWPSMAVNYTTKTQFIFRINKGCLDITDDKIINKYVEMKDRPFPFERIIYIGDGSTDVPCMKLVKQQGGHSIAVYEPRTRRKEAVSLKKEGRVDSVFPADFRKGRPLAEFVKLLISKIIADYKIGAISQI